MILTIMIFIISILFDAFLSSLLPAYIGNNSLFIPMFTVVAIIISLSFFNSNNKNYLICCGIFGFIYDILFTNTIFLNLTVFIFIGIITILLDNFLSNNLISMITKMIISIFIYDLITYLILLLVGYIDYSLLIVLIKFVNSIIINLIYIILLYYITNFISYKFKIKKTI